MCRYIKLEKEKNKFKESIYYSSSEDILAECRSGKMKLKIEKVKSLWYHTAFFEQEILFLNKCHTAFEAASNIYLKVKLQDVKKGGSFEEMLKE